VWQCRFGPLLIKFYRKDKINAKLFLSDAIEFIDSKTLNDILKAIDNKLLL